jgi:hypothetical protein
MWILPIEAIAILKGCQDKSFQKSFSPHAIKRNNSQYVVIEELRGIFKGAYILVSAIW